MQAEGPRRRTLAFELAIGIAFAALGISAVLVGTPRADETIPTIGTTAARDTFGRPGNLARRWLSGSPRSKWETIGSEWQVRRGEVGPVHDRPSFAVATRPPHVDTLGATVTALENGSGVVVGFRDEQNHVRVTAAPDFGTWIVTRVRDGREERVGTLGLRSVGNGDRLTVRWRGTELCGWVEFIQHNSRLTCIDVGASVGHGRIGLVADERSSDVRFDNVVLSG